MANPILTLLAGCLPTLLLVASLIALKKCLSGNRRAVDYGWATVPAIVFALSAVWTAATLSTLIGTGSLDNDRLGAALTTGPILFMLLWASLYMRGGMAWLSGFLSAGKRVFFHKIKVRK